MDKLFRQVFQTVDSTLGVQANQSPSSDPRNQMPNSSPAKGKGDETICPTHRHKKNFFCEECCIDLCPSCKDKHSPTHPVKFLEATSEFVI